MAAELRANTARAWFLAARPKTLAGAAAPVIMGGACAWTELAGTWHDSARAFNWTAFLLCMLFAWIMQIDANFINDYFDFRKGRDTERRLGPERACANGWISPGAMKAGIAVTTVLACMAGAPLILTGGWWMIAVGGVCVLFCFLYTTLFSKLGLGDLLVLLFFGIVPAGFTFFLITGEWTPEATLTGLSCGLAVDCLLVVNNYRDREEDAANGKRTLAVRFGGRISVAAYFTMGLAAAILAAYVLASTGKAWKILFLLPYAILHTATAYGISRTDGRELNRYLGKTSRNFTVLSIFFAMASAL